MMLRGVGSLRVAQLALAALMCAGLWGCGPDSSTGAGSTAGSAAAASASSGIATSGNSLAGPTDKSVMLSWSAPSKNSDGSSITNLAGYTLHYGTESEDYTGSIVITTPTKTSYVVSGSTFPPGTYFFAISAYNAQQVSSSMSGEVSVTVD